MTKLIVCAPMGVDFWLFGLQALRSASSQVILLVPRPAFLIATSGTGLAENCEKMNLIRWLLFTIAFVIYVVIIKTFVLIAFDWLNSKAFPINSFYDFFIFFICFLAIGITLLLFMWVGALIIQICPKIKLGSIIFLWIYAGLCAFDYYVYIKNNEVSGFRILADLTVIFILFANTKSKTVEEVINDKSYK